MQTIASVTVALQTLRSNPFRTLLSTLGIIVGAASLVAVLSLGDGMEAYARGQVSGTTDLQVLSVEPRTVEMIDGQAYQLTDYLVLARDDASALAGAVPEASAVELTLLGVSPVRLGNLPADSAIVRLTLATDSAAAIPGLGAGRSFTLQEALGNLPVAVISWGLAERLGHGSAAGAIGGEVLLRDRARRVVGVLSRPRFAELLPTVVVPLEGAADALSPTPRPRAPTIILQARTIEAVGPMRTATERWLAERLGGSWKKKVRIHTQQERVEQVTKAIALFKAFMGAITGISLLVGGIGIMNVLLAAVTERTREIGVRKAAGARSRDVLLQFLAESVAIAGAGSCMGLVGGLVGAFGITALIRQHQNVQVYAAFSWNTLGVAAISALTLGVSFGIYPALRAARLSPIDAIRHE